MLKGPLVPILTKINERAKAMSQFPIAAMNNPFEIAKPCHIAEKDVHDTTN